MEDGLGQELLRMFRKEDAQGQSRGQVVTMDKAEARARNGVLLREIPSAQQGIAGRGIFRFMGVVVQACGKSEGRLKVFSQDVQAIRSGRKREPVV